MTRRVCNPQSPVARRILGVSCILLSLGGVGICQQGDCELTRWVASSLFAIISFIGTAQAWTVHDVRSAFQKSVNGLPAQLRGGSRRSSSDPRDIVQKILDEVSSS